MFEEYQQYILQLYRNKKSAKELPRELMKPTVANLKKAALKTIDLRYHPKYDKVLSDFFGAHTNADGYRAAISKTVPDDYKTIYRWIRGEIGVTGDENVGLFLWLIDLEIPPFNAATDYGALLRSISDNNNIKVGEDVKDKSELKVEEGHEKKIEEQGRRETEISVVQIKPNNTSRLKRVLIGSLAVVLVIVLGKYLWYNRTKVIEPHCMYWNGEEYKYSSCSVEKDYPSQVITLDTIKQMRLKRNMRPDTLTAYSIGKVWYIHIRGRYEYYTDSGYYPLDTNLRLLEVSAQILNTDYPREPVK